MHLVSLLNSLNLFDLSKLRPPKNTFSIELSVINRWSHLDVNVLFACFLMIDYLSFPLWFFLCLIHYAPSSGVESQFEFHNLTVYRSSWPVPVPHRVSLAFLLPRQIFISLSPRKVTTVKLKNMSFKGCFWVLMLWKVKKFPQKLMKLTQNPMKINDPKSRIWHQKQYN